MTNRTHIRGAETDTRSVQERFGGIDTPAALGGMFATLGTLVFLTSLLAAGGGSLAYSINALDVEGNLQELEAIGIVVVTLVVLISGFVGGWVAGRMAHYDGVMNGVGSAMWLTLLIALFAAAGYFFGTEYNAFQQAGLPDWFSQLDVDDLTATVALASAAALLALFGGSMFGGAVGEGYNRKVNAALADEAHTAPLATDDTTITGAN